MLSASAQLAHRLQNQEALICCCQHLGHHDDLILVHRKGEAALQPLPFLLFTNTLNFSCRLFDGLAKWAENLSWFLTLPKH
jgi:hypothetical protein